MNPFLSLQFLTMLVGFVLYVVKFFVPNWPFDETLVLAVVLGIMSLFGIVPNASLRGVASAGDLIRKREFWTLLVGVLGLGIRLAYPAWPFADEIMLMAVMFVLGLFGIKPELMAQKQKWMQAHRK